MASPITERISMTWKTFSSCVVSRPATIMTSMQASQPAIQSAALMMGDTASFLRGFCSVQHVVDVEIALVERPRATERTVHDSDDLLRLDLAAAQAAHDLGGLEEFLPVVRAARQPAQHILRARN